MDRRLSIYKLTIDGLDSTKLGLFSLIERVEVEEADTLASMLSITLNNTDLRFCNDDMFQEAKTKFEFHLGYTNNMSNFGKFILEKPSFTFPADGNAKCTLRCMEEDSYLLATSDIEDSSEYKDLTYSEIVKKIARLFRLKSDIDSSEGILEKTIASGTSYMKFLQDLAEKAGNFQVFIDNKVLHFHKVRPTEILYYDNKPIILIYNKTEEGSLISFNISSLTFGKGRKAVAQGIDPITKEVYKVESTGQPADITKSGIKEVKYSDLVQTVLPIGRTKTEYKRPIGNVINIGHVRSKSEMKRIVEGIEQADSWTIEGNATTYGIELIRARKNIWLAGLGKFSGKFYIKSARHTHDGNGYNTSFDVKSTGTQKPQPSKKTNLASRLNRVGIGTGSKKAPVDVTDKSEIKGKIEIIR